MKKFRHLLRRAGLLSRNGKSRKSARRSTASLARRLSNEALERRELLAGDLGHSNYHNQWSPCDVNNDLRISALDALGVINYLTRQGEGEDTGGLAGGFMYYDVNNDNSISAADALGVINALGEGEGVAKMIELIITARDDQDAMINPDPNGDVNVNVGEKFFIEVSYADLRSSTIFSTEQKGVFQLLTDLTVSQPDILAPVLNEVQFLEIDPIVTDPATNPEGVVLSISDPPPGVTDPPVPYSTDVATFFGNRNAAITAALESFGYTSEQFEVNNWQPPTEGAIGNEIHWIGEDLGNVDLPTVSIQILADVEVPTTTHEYSPFLEDGSPNPEAVRYNIDFHSRSFGGQFYGGILSYGGFQDQTGFERSGGVGIIGPGSIQEAIDELDPPINFPQPFDSFSLPVYLKSPITDFSVTVAPASGESEAILVFGNGVPTGDPNDPFDPKIPPELVLIETQDDNSNGEAGVVSGIGQLVFNAMIDAPGVLAFDPSNVTVDEDAGVASLTVTRVEGSVGAVSVDYATVPGTAEADVDFSVASGTLNFADGETFKTLTIPIINDSVIDPNEVFTVVLTNATGGASLGEEATATVTIDDDEIAQPGQFNLEASTASFDENAGTVSLTVNRTGGSDGSVSVTYATANGTALAGSDYSEATGTLVFANGETSKTISIDIVDDTDFEGNETFALNLSNPTGGATIGTGQTTITIVDNDVLTPGVIALSSAAASVDENAGNIELTVERTGGSDGEVTVDFTTNAGTASEGVDYTLTSGTLTFADGVTTQTITVPILDDSEIDPNETFNVTLSNVQGGAALGTVVTTTVTIVDDEQPGTLAFLQSEASVNEDDGTLTLTVARTGGSDGEVTVSYATADGTAEAGQDYTSNSGTLVFAEGETSKNIVLQITDDIDIEANETLTVSLTEPTGGAVLGAINLVTVTIIEDDVPGVLAFSTDTASVSEDGNSITLTVSRTNGNDGEVSVAFDTNDGTAIAGQDFTAQSGTLDFGNGVTSQEITIPIIDNTEINNDKVFTVKLSNVLGGASLGDLDTVSVTILENDIQLLFDPSSITVNENAGQATLTVTRIGDADAAVSVDFETENDTAVAGEDYQIASGTLTFAEGVMSQSVAVTLIDDVQQEQEESFKVNLSNPTGVATLGSAPTATVDITSDDVAGTLSIDTVATVGEQDGTVALTITRANGSDGIISVDFQTSDDSAIAGEDYTANSGTITFAHNELSKQIEIAITDDLNGSEGDETFFVDLSNGTGGAAIGNSRATVTIENFNEAPTISNVEIDPRSEEDPIFTVSEADLLEGAQDRESDTLVVSNLVIASGDGQGITVNPNSLTVDPAGYGYLEADQSAVIEYTYDISDGSNTINNKVIITITGFNDAPVAENDTAIAFKNATSNIRVLDNDNAGDGETQVLTITTATSPNGTVEIKGDGTIDFTPEQDFLGDTTIDYTIVDSQGKTDSATVSVDVKDFLPSTFAGHVFIDEIENSASDIAAGADPIRNGEKDADEQGLMGALVSLYSSASDNVTGLEVEEVALADVDGAFSFTNLAPGTYTVTYQATDSVLFTGQSSLVYEIPAGGGLDVTDFNYALLSLKGQADILASSYYYRDGGVVSLDDSGVQEFITSLDGFAENIKFVEFAISSDLDSALLTLVEDDKDVMTAKLSKRDFRLFGDAAFFFTGQNDLTFLSEAELAGLAADYPSYRDAVDEVLADM